ncbi:MAG TPA: cytochrome c [Gemmatimonadetes bacterium]|nr:cytochrome c [Gemmatimonadota bacterium]
MGAIVLTLLLGLSAGVGEAAAQDGGDLGQVTYDRWCAGCHGVDGTGNGPAEGYMLPRPRDFSQALYQLRSTASGGLPTDADLLAVIDNGMPGTTMPGWEAILSGDEKDALVG